MEDVFYESQQQASGNATSSVSAIDPFGLSSGFGPSFQRHRGLLRDPSKLPLFAEATHTVATQEGVYADITIDPRLATFDGLRTTMAQLDALNVTHLTQYRHVIGGLVPFHNIAGVAEMESVRVLRASQARVVPVADASVDKEAASAREMYGVNGSTVRCVGVLSDSFNNTRNFQDDIDVVAETDTADGNDEGARIMRQVHEALPGLRSFAFNTALHGQAAFAAGIESLTEQTGCNVLVDHVTVLQEPFFADSVIAEAIDTVAAKNTSYFSAAGGFDAAGLFETYEDSGVSETVSLFGRSLPYTWHKFSSTSDFDLPIRIAANTTATLVLNWADPYVSAAGESSGGALTDLDLFLFTPDGADVLASGISSNKGADPIEIAYFTNDGPGEDFIVRVGKYITHNASTSEADFESPDPDHIGLVGFSVIDVHGHMKGPTQYGHSTAAGASAVEAPQTEGPLNFPLLYDATGQRLPEVTYRPTAGFASADAAQVVALAAMIRESDEALTPTEVNTVIQQTNASVTAALAALKDGSWRAAAAPGESAGAGDEGTSGDQQHDEEMLGTA
ncbi:unnamed protein product [Vitrella brassicaformis CCMP3155]|uniref:Uncharacterized protein n=2 Tax=Vitrella brassicaformis TaxID=1169539 RepID=A0A0G4GBS1_VITBC|nr:unnamed protein product [Vitrella brassicaformis CCMP3155]|eukprot:CEM26465.1 unnamed protein product [Vitrella brassicaformis CCMP3155]